MYVNGAIPERQWRTGFVEAVDRRLRTDSQAEHAALLDHAGVKKQVVTMQPDGRAGRHFGLRDAGHMIEMGVREQNQFDLRTILLAASRSSSTSSPGSMITASRVRSHTTT
jgi:hypothetical protein